MVVKVRRRNKGHGYNVVALPLQEASATFAEWEILMKGLRSGVETTESPFTQVMGLVTQMYKQTAVAKVMTQLWWSARDCDILSFYEPSIRSLII